MSVVINATINRNQVFGLDPGPVTSGVVLWDVADNCVNECSKELDNDGVVHVVKCMRPGDVVACEWIESFGMPVGKDVFETIFFIGRIAQICEDHDIRFERVTRRQVKLNLCNSMRANDTNVRAAIIDRFGGKKEAIGLKKTPGPLYGVSSHAWSALAVVLTHLDQEAA